MFRNTKIKWRARAKKALSKDTLWLNSIVLIYIFKIEFDAKTGEWVGQELSVFNMWVAVTSDM